MIAPPGDARTLRADPDELDLELPALRLLGVKVFRVVCSEPWQRHCVGLILHGDVGYKPAEGEGQAKELRRKGVYPPGGFLTGMIRCKGRCGKFVPPQTIGQNGECLDCHYEGLPLYEKVKLQSSPGFDRRFKDADVAAHFGTSTDTRGKTTLNAGVRVRPPRYLKADGDGHYSVREPFDGDDGCKYETVYPVTGSPEAAPPAAATPGAAA